MRTLLVDGDFYAFQAAAAEEKTAEFDGVISTYADLATGIENLDLTLASFMERLRADRMVVALSDYTEPNFRLSVLPSYKAARENIKEPTIRQALLQHLRDTYETKSKPRLEGDDVLGILATNPKLYPGEKIIVAKDKDLRTIPGLHWDPTRDRDVFGIREISEAEADRFHLMQTLTGDRTDGYTGCPGIGPARAAKILDEDCSWAAVVAAYEKRGLTEADALVQARVARICRHSDYNYKTQEPILWTP